jgi:hypothetical protein
MKSSELRAQGSPFSKPGDLPSGHWEDWVPEFIGPRRCPYCAGHPWTICSACGREGSRAST